jgi:hypothetical protein
MSAPAYNAFSAMLHVSLILELPPFYDDGGDEKLIDSFCQPDAY